jgi:tetratricopeptide (TPR) repeat protein
VIPISLVFFRSLKWKNALSKSLPYLIPFFIYMLSRISVLGSMSGNKTIAKIDNLLMAAPNEAVRLATAIKILGLYLWKLIVPYPLMNDYSLQQITLSNFQDWKVIVSFLTYSLLIFLIFKLRNTHKILSFAILFYLINLFLYSNLLYTIGTSFGERLLFIPSLGFSIAIAYLLYKLFHIEFEKIDFRASKLLSLIILILFFGYSYQTISRNRAWKDNYTLYTTDVKNCDQSARCHYYHGLGLMKEKALNEKDINVKNALIKESIQAFTRSIEILPTYSNAYGQRGIAYYRLNNLELAVKDYEKSIQFNPMNATTLSNLGSVYFQTQQYQKAKDAYARAIKANPNFVDALANYASTLGTLGEYNSAITYFKRAIAIRPNEPSYYQMTGLTYKNMGNQQQANIYFRKAQELRRQK